MATLVSLGASKLDAASLAQKQEKLFSILEQLGRVMVAYSGGTDSAFLAWAAHRALSDNAIARAEKWSKSETKAFQLHLPQRRPDEPLATTDQIAEINGLALSIAGSGMVNLGSEQAEFLIHELQSVRDLFSEIKIHEYLDRQRSTSRLFVILSMAVIGYALISVSH